MDLRQRLAHAMDAISSNIAEVARRLDIKPQAVYQWETGETRPSVASLRKIADLTGISVDWLMSGRGSVPQSGLAAYDELRGRVVPRIDWSEIADFADIVERNRGPHGRTSFACGPRSFQATIADDANETASDPRHAIYRGDIATIDPDASVTPGSMVVVLIDGGAIVREFRPRHDHVELSPLNPRHREYKIQDLTPEMLVGVVIETARRRS